MRYGLKEKSCLPDFLILGGQKCGTEFLAYNLAKHPDVFMPEPRKENGHLKNDFEFFDVEERYRKGIDFYKEAFKDNEQKIKGEKTASYLFNEFCHERIAEYLPDVKIIIIMRDPVKRMMSHFAMDKLKNNFLGDFKDYIDCQDNLERGYYIKKIKNLLRFFRKEQILTLISERSKDDPEGTFDAVCEFLKIENNMRDVTGSVNTKKYNKPCGREIEEKLYEKYRLYNEELFKFLGERIEEWNIDR